MKILTADPSSSAIGYALGSGPRDLETWGVMTARGNAIDRSRAMAQQFADMSRRLKPDGVVVETPAPQAPAGKRGAAGQATYGMAVGILLAHLWLLYGDRIECVPSDVWTRKVKKKHRQLCVISDFPQYDPKRDKGLDGSDAIALMQWWFAERRLKEAVA